MNHVSQKSLLNVLALDRADRPPIRFMRQARRSLADCRALQKRAPQFIALCLSPQMATEAALQAMRRFAFDAAVVFSDISLIPAALVQEIWLEAGRGPSLGSFLERALIDFAPGPWPVETDVLKGLRGDLAAARSMSERDNQIDNIARVVRRVTGG